ncbi:MAG: 1-(5-phosphoribosyl)-5-[(5-phosphoribosylamino)methylideneamino]imidazole-4-carboxamide isomerase [Eubacteriaceae bacterium]
MLVIPAIDIKDGKCVRLTQGNFNKETIYFEDPLEVAKMWENNGAKYLHLVDLDGALKGEDINYEIISKITKNLNIPVQVGGGIRNRDRADKYLSVGVNRIILGTSAVNNYDLVKDLCNSYPEKIAVSIDAKDELVAIKGWVETSNIKALDFAKDLENLGVSTIIYTDISKDGMMSGPNYEALCSLKEHVNTNIIASGGIANIGHIRKLESLNLYGAITGKALYEGTLTIEEIYA